MLPWMNGQKDNLLFREWFLSASSKSNPVRRLEEMILLIQHVRFPYRERHGSCLRKSVRRLSLRMTVVLVCAQVHTAPVVRGEFRMRESWRSPFLLRCSAFARRFDFCSRRSLFAKKFLLFCLADWKSNEVSIWLILDVSGFAASRHWLGRRVGCSFSPPLEFYGILVLSPLSQWRWGRFFTLTQGV